MIDRVIALSIRHRGIVIAAALVLAAWGVFAVGHTPIDAIPDLSENQVIVFTDWLGRSPQEIEDQITYPLSVSLQGLEGVRVVRSSSDCGFSMVSVIFDDTIAVQTARQEVSERLARAAQLLPKGIVPYLGPDTPATGQIFWYALEGRDIDLGQLRSLQDWYLRQQLSSVPGVAEVASVGGFPMEYQIDIDPERLKHTGVTLGRLLHAVAKANGAVGGHVIHKAGSEYVVRGEGWLGSSSDKLGSTADPQSIVRDLENIVLPISAGESIRLGDVAEVALGPQLRRGVFEKDGSEVTGGVVLMRHGENPLEVTRRLKAKIAELQVGLPQGVRIVPVYDRTPLIQGAVRTVTATLAEATIAASICVFIVLLHVRTSFVIAITLPLASLAAFLAMWLLRKMGIADIQTNIMSLAGIAVSIGILVDVAVVMAENVMFTLKNKFGDARVTGDVRELVLPACRTVGRPVFFAVLIMLLSFLPVFALEGAEGKMFRPLAATKSLALLAAAVLAITLVPALCTVFVRGRLRNERDSWLVRSVMDVYRPVLEYLLANPAALAWIVSVTFIVGFAPIGARWLAAGALFIALVTVGVLTRRAGRRWFALGSLIVIALVADQRITPLQSDFLLNPLDEGMVMDMPITIPRASITRSLDDLKARDMVLCHFPEVDMVVGKAGRAETATDPAPLDMIETMVNFRPVEFWPRRKLSERDARRQCAAVLGGLVDRKFVAAPADDQLREGLIGAATMAALDRFDAQSREYAYQRNLEFIAELGRELARFTVEQTAAMIVQNGKLSKPVAASDVARIAAELPTSLAENLQNGPLAADVARIARKTAQALGRLVAQDDDLLRGPDGWWSQITGAIGELAGWERPTFESELLAAVDRRWRKDWQAHIRALNSELLARGAMLYTRIAIEEFLARQPILEPKLAATVEAIDRWREEPPRASRHTAAHHHSAANRTAPPRSEISPIVDALQVELAAGFDPGLLLWAADRQSLTKPDGELDLAVKMPGWTNVWTRPIQNRVDMLDTGVNSQIGIRVLGRDMDEVVDASEAIAEAVKQLPGALGVSADPIRSKGYLEIRVDREQSAQLGVSVGEVNQLIETALAGSIATTTVEGRERHPVRVRYARTWREDEDAIRNLPVPARQGGKKSFVPLSLVADIRIVDGPGTINSENGLLRNYVRANVQGRSTLEFVDEARRAVAENVQLPPGVYVEWTGQFLHELRARRALTLIIPAVVGLIVLVLIWTYHDVVDALLMLLAVPGAIAGGVFFQWLCGYNFSIAVMVGYIACFGMASATGIVMLVYLREAVAKAGGLENISLVELRQAVLNGAVHRLRPKLLTEGTTIIGLAPMLWASGVGAEVIRPMAAPVLGGVLIADEVIDLLLPVLFYWVRRWRWTRLHGGQPPVSHAILNDRQTLESQSGELISNP